MEFCTLTDLPVAWGKKRPLLINYICFWKCFVQFGTSIIGNMLNLIFILFVFYLVGPTAPWCCHGGCGHRNVPQWHDCTPWRWWPASRCGSSSQQWCSWQRAGTPLVHGLWCTPTARKPHLNHSSSSANTSSKGVRIAGNRLYVFNFLIHVWKISYGFYQCIKVWSLIWQRYTDLKKSTCRTVRQVKGQGSSYTDCRPSPGSERLSPEFSPAIWTVQQGLSCFLWLYQDRSRG